MTEPRVSTGDVDLKYVQEGHGAPMPINPETKQHRAYWILSEEERAKGFIRPIRNAYVHDKCGIETRMGSSIAETYARDPSSTGQHFAVAVETTSQ
jgi:hypothetical protein